MKLKISLLFSAISRLKKCDADMAIKETPIMVSGLVVNTSIFDSSSFTAKLKFIPSDFPIQFFCCIFTCSGQPSNLSVPSNNSSA